MESRQLQGILFPRQNLFSLLLSQTLTRVESTSAGESYAQVHGISNALKNMNIALEKIYSESIKWMTCSPSNTGPVEVEVHIVQGKIGSRTSYVVDAVRR